MSIAVLLLPCAFVAIARLVRYFHEDTRLILLVSAVWWAVCLDAITELLSAFTAVNAPALAAAWMVVIAVAVLWDLRYRSQGRAANSGFAWRDLARIWTGHEVTREERFLLVAIAAISICIGLTAVLSPPNGYDVAQYHLTRVVQWAERHSVRFFPAFWYAPLFQPPLAEFAILHSYILSGSDLFANLFQWLAFNGCLLGVAVLTKQLGGNRRAQFYAASFCATLPQGILAASGSKNDWILSLWVVVAIILLFQWRNKPDWAATLTLGAAVGAAVLTKGHSLLVLVPIVVAVAFTLGLRAIAHRCKYIAAALFLTVAMNAAQFARNMTLNGSIFGPRAGDARGQWRLPVDRVSAGGTLSTMLRIFALNFGAPIEKVGHAEEGLVRRAVSILGQNPDDPATTFRNSRFYIPHSNRDEYGTGNPIQSLLLIGALGAVLISWRRYGTGALLLSVSVIGGYILFCALIKWQAASIRLLLPLYVLGCCLLSLVIVRSWPRLVKPLAGVLLLVSLPYVFANETRPLLITGTRGLGWSFGASLLATPRDQWYTGEEFDLTQPYLWAARAATRYGCSDIGLDLSLHPISSEYPIMAFLRELSPHCVVRYYGVDNPTARYASTLDRPLPCAIICRGCAGDAGKFLAYGKRLPAAQTEGDIVVFTSPPPPAAISLAEPRNQGARP